MEERPPFHVITGGPGTGKSTLIAALAAAGHWVCEEVARPIIRAQVAASGNAVPWGDHAAFAALMFAGEKAAYDAALAADQPVFFDRGFPDIAGFLALSGLPTPAEVDAACRTLRYRSPVFITPPWADTFIQDSERKQAFAEAERTHAAMIAVYSHYGYTLVELPRASVAARMAFLLERVGV